MGTRANVPAAAGDAAGRAGPGAQDGPYGAVTVRMGQGPDAGQQVELTDPSSDTYNIAEHQRGTPLAWLAVVVSAAGRTARAARPDPTTPRPPGPIKKGARTAHGDTPQRDRQWRRA
ncbi:hypothetical protein [Micromonospora sp. RTGN7]|uniref:hypothetical protein n=1 Tax=Micromonospora sp. RTGN7 TaxID=3016526 RepID=UPI0029FF0DE1|nr:hypothetical protein [Micromonospora sp. RTGN7]